MGSRTVCFVCGNLGADSGRILYTKPRLDKGPYFPFLEDHEPPKGARLLGADGTVDSCRVCHAFLTQQWDTYERNKTPSVKRLYWLKRSDNGQFTGAEMRLQGEYIAQVMGLQYNPGSVDSGFNSSSPNVTKSRLIALADPYAALDTRGAATDVALDLSVHKNNGHSSTSRDYRTNNTDEVTNYDPHVKSNSNNSNTNIVTDKCRPSSSSSSSSSSAKYVCFTCGALQQWVTRRFIFAFRQPSGDPYFPFLTRLSARAGAAPLSDKGIAAVCSICRRTLYQQWKEQEMANVGIENRTYVINKEKYPDTKDNICISSSINAGGGGSNSSHVIEKTLSGSNNSSSSNATNKDICYLCGQFMSHSSSRLLHTTLTKDSRSNIMMHFPFIRDLPRPEGAHPLNPDGTVIACRVCVDHIAAQWHMYESQGVKLSQRQFTLPINHNRATYTYQSSDSSNFPTSEGDVSQPLNIQITSGSPVPTVPTGSQGLLAIATPISSSSTAHNNGDVSNRSNVSSVYSNQFPSSSSSSIDARRIPVDMKPNVAALDNSLNINNSSSSNIITAATIPHPLQCVSSLPKKVCFLCGESCLVANMHVLCSYPARHDAKVPNGQTNPFFPFLASRDPAQGAETMSDEGTVMSCQYCYHMLLKQWKDYEICKTPGTSNRWLRKYVLKNFTCYVCSRTAERKKICTLQVPKFPFLKDHKVPQGALVMDSGESVVVCKGCSRSLHRQFTEFERMGLRIELRKYNWIQPPGDDSLDEVHNQTDENGPTLVNSSSHGGGDGHDNQTSAADLTTTTTASTHWPSSSHAAYSNMHAFYPFQGLPQGAKPPPLTMVNSGASKVTRNTATVQPLNQVSSSPSNSVTSISGNAALNATRTSSFAAALRKLANQAKDPDDGPSVKAVPTTSVSPRSSTPKRGPPPLVYSSQSSSSSYLTPPPVVTIAPTQAHPTHLHSEAHSQNLERTHSVQSSSSSLYDPLTIKQERDHRPLSSQSRDGDTAKECIIQPSHRTTSSALSSSSSTHGRDDLPPRGFQPYRPEEEIRPMLPSPFGLDATYPYHPALFAHQAYPHPAFSRIDDPLVLERCRLMHPPFMPFTHPGIIPPPGVHPFLSSSRYPTDLLHQQYPQYLPNSSRLAGYRSPGPNDRSRADDEKIKRIDSDREIEREKEREREIERQKEFEQREQQEKERLRELERQQQQLERQHDVDRRKSEVNYMREEERRHTLQQSESTYSGSITQGTPRDLLYVERLAPPQNSSNGLPEQGHHSQRGRRTPYESGDHCSSSSSSSLLPVASHQLKQEQEVQPTSRHSSSPAMHLEERRKHHSYLTKNDFTIPRTSKEQSSNVSNSNSSSHSCNQKSSDKHHDTQDDRRSAKPPPLVAPVRSGSNSDLERADKNSESGLFRPYDVLHPYRYSSHPYPDSHKVEKVNSYDNTSGRSSNNSRSNEQCITKHEPPSEGPSSRQRNTQDEFQFDVNSSICSQVVTKAHPPELLNHYSSYFRSGFYDRSLSGHINSVVDASFHIFPDQSLVSKLDLEEEKMRESRLDGTYCSDSEEDEELTVAMEMERKQQLCIITTNPPLALDKSPSKMRYFKSMGLTTHSRRKDVEFERYRKRRHMFREGSLSPLSTRENTTEPVPKLNVPPPFLSEQMCMQSDYKQKCRYLHTFLLTPLTGDKKKEYETIREACEEEKARRLGFVLENVSQPQQQQKQQPDEQRLLSEPVKRSKPALLDSLHRRVKRKSSDMEGTSQVSNKLEQPSRPKISLNQLQERHLAATASSSSSTSSSSSSSSQPHYLKQTSVSTLPSATPSLQLANPSRTSQENSRPLIFPENRGDSRDHRRLKEKFAQEFHESVLASTFSNKSSNGRTGIKSVDSRDSSVTHLSAVSSILQQSQKPSSHDSHSSLCSRSDDGRLDSTDSFNGQPLFKWPGIETILGTYQRYLEEQKLERHILNDRCQKLKTDNIDLNRTAEKLSRKVSSLLESKNHDDEELCRMRNSVDALRRYCLQLPR